MKIVRTVAVLCLLVLLATGASVADEIVYGLEEQPQYWKPLQGASVAGKIYVRSTLWSQVDYVEFRIDSNLEYTDHSAPFALGPSGTPFDFDLRPDLAIGTHVLQTRTILKSGGTLISQASFTIKQRSERNPVVEDVVSAFTSLGDRGEFLGFNMNQQSPDAFKNPFGHHFQGIARSPSTDRAPVLYVSYGGYVPEYSPHPDPHDTDFGALMVVELGSRSVDGERLRSNRLLKGANTRTTMPPDSDKVVAVYKTLETGHPCGMSMVGDILAVPGGPRIGEDDGLRRDQVNDRFRVIRFYDCVNPTYPRLLEHASLEHPAHGEWAVAITKLPGPDGKFFVAIPTGDGVYFYKSNTSTFLDPDFQWELDSFTSKHIIENIFHMGDFWPFRDDPDDDCSNLQHYGGSCHGGMSFQSLQFVNEADGDLYLIGSATSDVWSPAREIKLLGTSYGKHEGEEWRSVQRLTDEQDCGATRKG